MFGFFKRKKETEEKIERNEINIQPWIDQLKQLSDGISNVSKAVRNLEARTQDIIERLDSMQEKVERHEEDINNIKDSVEKMFVLYDYIMKQYNPFIEEEQITKKEEKISKEDSKKIEIKKYSEYLPLDEIKEDPSFIAIIMGWLNYLVTKSNIQETLKALEYYQDIGWITEDVKIKLEKYLAGYKNVKTQNSHLTPEDHLVSLYIITKLKAGIEEGIIKFKDLYMELVNRGIIKPVK